jgi:uncharacterized membrane protein
MDMKRLAIGTIVGGVVVYVVGYLMFEVMLAQFYAANVGSATGVVREPTLEWPIALGAASLALFITLCIANRAEAQTIGGGLTAGASIGFLVWFTTDFTLYGFTNMNNLTLTILDPLFSAIPAGIAGAVIAAVLAKIPKGAGVHSAA